MTRPLSATRRQILIDALAGAAAMSLLPIAGAAASGAGTAAGSDPVHDFDLFFGTWHVRHRRLKERLAGSTEWVEFDGTQEMRPLLGGQGNFTDNVLNMPDGAYRAVTLRAFDPKTKTWAIWWLDGRKPHTIEVPLIGRFEDGGGAFYADDKVNGKPIRIRYLWSKITPDSRQWEQAFSPDGGNRWETNWVAQFTRTG